MNVIKNNSEITRALLIGHYDAYPKSEIRDFFKFLHHSALGCGHLVSSESAALEFIEREYVGIEYSSKKTERLDGDFCRVHLCCISDGLSKKTLARLFYLSAKHEQGGVAILEEKLCVMRQLISEGILPFDINAFDSELEAWKNEGYPAMHHSDTYREEYRPAYRVIAKKYADYLQLFTKIDILLSGDNAIIAIEGGSASGKSTLSDILSEVYGCTVFHMDDFFLRPEQRTPERLSEVGGNIDKERFMSEVLTPLKNGKTVRYRPFDCSSQSLGEEITVTPGRLTVIEGVYSMHPEFSHYFDLAVFLDISPEEQRKRILLRNSPQFAQRFFGEWIPLENIYFEKTEIKKRADLIKVIESQN